MTDASTARSAMTAQINALNARKRQTADANEIAAIDAAIDVLQDAIDASLVWEMDRFAAEIDALVVRLDEVRTSRNLDAASALGRSIDSIREATSNPG